MSKGYTAAGILFVLTWFCALVVPEREGLAIFTAFCCGFTALGAFIMQILVVESEE